jgi:hypothetical protein
MADVLEGLRPVFREQIGQLMTLAQERGVKLVPTSGARDPWRQARLWRRSRTTEQVQSKISQLRDSGAPYLADILQSVGPQPNGSWRTDAPPGLSWHQLGEAVDFGIRSPNTGRVLLGDTEQDGDEYQYGQDCYDRLGSFCVELGLKWGGDFNDQNHVQRSQNGSPLADFSLAQINEKIEALWPEEPG